MRSKKKTTRVNEEQYAVVGGDGMGGGGIGIWKVEKESFGYVLK